MKVTLTSSGQESKVTFIPETIEEKRIMGTLRNHFFLGLHEECTYPEYGGITSEENFVTSLSLVFDKFNH